MNRDPCKRVRPHADELVLLTIARTASRPTPCALEGADDHLSLQGHAPGPKVWLRRRHYEQAAELVRSMQAGEHEIAPEE